MRTTHRPPPLPLSGTRSKSKPRSTSRVARKSDELPLRQPEKPADAPASASASSSAHAKDHAARRARSDALRQRQRRKTSKSVKVLRMVSETVHTFMCLFLIIIMAFYLSFDKTAVNRSSGPPAISLLAFLVVDMLLNFYSIAHFDSPIPGGSVLIRCVLIFGYIFIFFAYLASNGPFPSTYSFWGIKADLTSVVIYVFIWIISVWDLAVVVLNREALLVWLTDLFDRASERVEDQGAAALGGKDSRQNRWYRDPKLRASQTDLESGQAPKTKRQSQRPAVTVGSVDTSSESFVGQAL